MQYVARQCRSILLLCWGLGPSPFSPAMIPSHLYSTSSSKPPVPPGARCIHIASSSFDHSHQWDDRLCRTRWEVEGAPSSLPLPLAQAHLRICQSANLRIPAQTGQTPLAPTSQSPTDDQILQTCETVHHVSARLCNVDL